VRETEAECATGADQKQLVGHAALSGGAWSESTARTLTFCEPFFVRTGNPKWTVVTLDSGPIHVSKATRTALAEREHRLTIEWLPKYAPELNDAEEVWRDLKRHYLAHQTFTGAEDLTHAIHDAVKKLNKERTRHPLGRRRIAV
jgi:transposase